MKRYTMDWHYEREIEDPDGEWVKFEDIEIFTMGKMIDMVRPLKMKGPDTQDGKNIS